MSETVLAGVVRQAGRKGPARRLRAAGKLPGVVYGRGENISVTVDSKDVLKILESKGGANRILTTKFEGDGKERKVMIKELEVHPMTDKLIHVDLLEIELDKPVSVAVSLEFTGVPKGVKEKGGRLAIHKNKLNVESLPADIPPVIIVPIAGLDAGEDLRVKDIKLSGEVRALDDPEAMLVAVIMPKLAEEAAAEGEAEEGEEAAPAKEGKTPAGEG
ncbi:MAG: 50S ribosomal protein L25 [Candidatus Nitrospinota bacterium M3_3B_026]